MARPLKNLFFPTIDVYTVKTLEAAQKYKYVAFLLPRRNHDPRLFQILRNHVYVRITVMRKETIVLDENVYSMAKVRRKTKRIILNNIYGIADKVLPNPPREILEEMVKYSGYDNVDDWILDFCEVITRKAAKSMAYLCVHKGYGKTIYSQDDVRVYLITAHVLKISKNPIKIGSGSGSL